MVSIPFPKLWTRRSTVEIDDNSINLMSLPDLVQAKKHTATKIGQWYADSLKYTTSRIAKTPLPHQLSGKYCIAPFCIVNR